MNTKPQPTTIDWPSQISAWRESGLPMTRYCQQHGLVTHQLSYHKRKLDSRQAPSKATNSGFIQVHRSPQQTAENLTLRLRNGIVIEGITPSNLDAVVLLTKTLS